MKHFHALVAWCLLSVSTIISASEREPSISQNIPPITDYGLPKQLNTILTHTPEQRAFIIDRLIIHLKANSQDSQLISLGKKLYEELSSLYLFELSPQLPDKELSSLHKTMHLMFHFSIYNSEHHTTAYPFRYALLATLLEAFKSKALSVKNYNAQESYERSLLAINQALIETQSAPSPDAQKLCKPTKSAMKKLANCLLYDLESYVPSTDQDRTWHDTVSTVSSTMLKLSVACAFILPIYAVGHIWYFYGDSFSYESEKITETVNSLSSEVKSIITNTKNLIRNTNTLVHEARKNL